jgi:shikimate dehydrogenase
MTKPEMSNFLNDCRVFGLFGNPVGHSLSPLMHNAAYREMRFNALYVPFCVRNLEEAVRGIGAMSLGGVSITIPFKSAVVRYLDDVEESVHRIGAANTIVNNQGRLKGYNTDWIGFVRDLKEFMPVKGKTFAVLGAGGAARAVIFGILAEGGNIVVLNRTIRKGQALADEFGCSFSPPSEIAKLSADCFINTTPVGMYPNIEDAPLEPMDLKKFAHVVDIVYNPVKTKLLKDAEAAGCRIRSGIGMFVYQAAEQIRLWTGMEPPLDSMKRVVLERLEKYERD